MPWVQHRNGPYGYGHIDRLACNDECAKYAETLLLNEPPVVPQSNALDELWLERTMEEE